MKGSSVWRKCRIYGLLLLSFFMFNQVGYADSSFLFTPSKAAEQTSGYYTSDVIPGGEYSFSFTLSNSTGKPVGVKIYAADAIPAQNGGKGFTTSQDTPQLAGSWVTSKKIREMALNAYEQRVLSYKVKVPDTLAPGQYIAGICAEELVPASAGTAAGAGSQSVSIAVDQINRTCIQVVMNYNTAIAKHGMDVVDFTHTYLPSGNSQLSFHLQNTGNILERPAGKLILKDVNGNSLMSQDYRANSIYQGTTATMNYLLMSTFLDVGSYTIYYEANFSGQTISKAFNFEITPENHQYAEGLLHLSGQLKDPLPEPTFADTLNAHTGIIITLGVVLFFLVTGVVVYFKFFRKSKKKVKTDSELDKVINLDDDVE